jgi:hypothetical protein
MSNGKTGRAPKSHLFLLSEEARVNPKNLYAAIAA